MNAIAPSLQTVAVTGASGFIGARLAELLANDHAISDVRILTRRRSGQKNARTVPLEDEAAVRTALQGCKAVVHCAFDFHNLPRNLDIARILARVCAQSGARLVQLSSWVVYGPVPDGDLSEDGAIRAGGDAYKDVKIAIEEMLLRSARDDGLDVVILQPTIVYGPFGSAWTDSPVRELLTGRVILPDMGEGFCNAVYVDDVCQAAISALRPSAPGGKRFLISGPQPVAWRHFIGAYESILGLHSLQLVPPVTGGEAGPTEGPPPSPASSRAKAMQSSKRLVARYLSVQSRTRLNMALKRLMRRLHGEVLHQPTGGKLALYRARCRVRTDRAMRELGYNPQFDLARGMAATAPYLRRTYLRN
jgi:nucleoside-diphosphate-sugar epimerase